MSIFVNAWYFADFFYSFVIRFVITSSKSVCTDFSLHVILKSHSLNFVFSSFSFNFALK